MLQLRFSDTTFWDEEHEQFVSVKGQTIQLEHSLVSISKWEAKWKKPFLSMEGHTEEETLDYIRCMTTTQNVNPLIYKLLNAEQLESVKQYIDDPMSATTIAKQEGKGASYKIITSEEIYLFLLKSIQILECLLRCFELFLIFVLLFD